MQELSAVRLNLLRGMYLLIAAGMGVQIWPGMFNVPLDLEHDRGVVRALLAALSLLCVLGLRYPARMIPLLLFELAWKATWVLAIGVPLWWAGQLNGTAAETMFACMMGVVLVPLVLPWPHLRERYLKAPAEPWRNRAAPAGEPVPVQA